MWHALVSRPKCVDGKYGACFEGMQRRCDIAHRLRAIAWSTCASRWSFSFGYRDGVWPIEQRIRERGRADGMGDADQGLEQNTAAATDFDEVASTSIGD